MNYIRFSTFIKVPNSNNYQGIFQTLGDLEHSGVMQDYEISWMKNTMDWFNKELNEPHTFSRSKKSNAHRVGICWYKSTANEYINKMYELVEILKLHSIEVNILKTNKPGYIVFEDEHQVVVEPFIEI